MASLIACISSEKGTQEHVRRIINDKEWDKIILVSDTDCSLSYDLVKVDSTRVMSDIAKDISNGIHGKISDFEVYVNFVSGSGKLHMALMSALLKLGLGIRLIALTRQGVREL